MGGLSALVDAGADKLPLAPIKLSLAPINSAVADPHQLPPHLASDAMNATWTSTAQNRLLDRRVARCGWGYRREGPAFAEPTALAALALLASTSEPSAEAAASEAGNWLAEIQQADGSIGLNARIPAPGWTTPYAVLLWAALGRCSTPREKATAWLLDTAGLKRPAGTSDVIGHDASIPGWPWVRGTCAWLEPTALAVLALGRQRLASHPRVEDGLRMICDRATVSGGWNFGNPSIFNTPLRPQPAPTGLALLALRASDGSSHRIQDGCRYLLRTLPRVRSPRSLGWGLLGLAAWNQTPAAADAWLGESFSRCDGREASAMDLAHLLLASSPKSLELLGVSQERLGDCPDFPAGKMGLSPSQTDGSPA